MSVITNPAFQGIRRILRTLGLTRPLGRLLARNQYERKFDSAMMAVVGQANVVWDIGANIGLYTKKFSEAAPSDAQIFAFEPSPRNSQALIEAFRGEDRVTIMPCALSNQAGHLFFEAALSGKGTTDRIVDYDTGLKVEVASADMLVFERSIKTPDFIKIDVEGFELHVIRGMERLLREHPPKHLFCEVHFTQLDNMGLKAGPKEIENILKKHKYTVEWTDSSHIYAHF